MNIVLLNWKDGENDPFSYINSELKLRFEDHGCNVDIVSTEGELAQNIFFLDYQKGIDAVISHQGIGSNTRLASNGKLIWDELKVCLICLHSDHPSHAPQNHNADSVYVYHTYCLTEFFLYANETQQRNHPAILLPTPSFYNPRSLYRHKLGDYFVFPKNIDPINETFTEWKNNLPFVFYKVLLESSQAIIDNYKSGDLIDHHHVINSVVSSNQIDLIIDTNSNLTRAKVLHYIHQQTDKIYRNAVSELVIDELHDLPLHINGRGWERVIKNASKFHLFSEFNNVTEGDYQFYSNYGIIDVVPTRQSLHDRTLRALAHGCGFLSNSRQNFNDILGDSFSSCFYSGIKHDLRSKAEFVMSNPEQHVNFSLQFRKAFENHLPFSDFISFIKRVSHNSYVE